MTFHPFKNKKCQRSNSQQNRPKKRRFPADVDSQPEGGQHPRRRQYEISQEADRLAGRLVFSEYFYGAGIDSGKN